MLNVEGAFEKVKGRLDKWNLLVPKMSYKGRLLIIHNLVASTLWHRLSCIDPPVDRLFKIQSCLVDLFWDKLHWVPKVFFTFLKKKEGLDRCINKVEQLLLGFSSYKDF